MGSTRRLAPALVGAAAGLPCFLPHVPAIQPTATRMQWLVRNRWTDTAPTIAAHLTRGTRGPAAGYATGKEKESLYGAQGQQAYGQGAYGQGAYGAQVGGG